MAIRHFGPEAWGPLALALRAYAQGDTLAVLHVHADQGEPDPMPVALFFRGEDGLREADRAALALSRGRILDGGAGVGSLTLLLQESGAEVTAVEVIPEAVEIMRARGVRSLHQGTLDSLPPAGAFDTILLLMNGTALAGTLAGLPYLLETLAGLLAPGGRVLLDSTDLLGGEDPEDEWGEEGYPGEVQYQMEFRGVRGAPFPQLFLDPRTLAAVAGGGGWATEVVWEGDEGEYLASLTRA